MLWGQLKQTSKKILTTTKREGGLVLVTLFIYVLTATS